jgi:hypothetical protein
MSVGDGVERPSGPGYALDYPEEVYHQGTVVDHGVPVGSLSTSRAKALIPPSTPAHFIHQRWGHKPAFDLGHAAHKLVLGKGAPIAAIPCEDWRTKAAKDLLAEARATGAIPLKTRDFERVHAMADALTGHPAAAELLTDSSGWPEVSMWQQDPEIGVWLRGRTDLLLPARRMIVDYKTTSRMANPEGLGKIVWTFHYELQAAWYLWLARSVGFEVDRFVFVAQETTPPYLVAVFELDPAALDVGRREMTDAVRLYARCVEAGRWPGYPDDVHTVALPAWAGNPNFDTASLEALIEEL